MTKRMISIALTAIMIVLVFCYPVSSLADVDYSYKLDPLLLKRLNSMNDNDMIDVSLWLSDINQSDVEEKAIERIKSTTSKDMLDVITNGECKEELVKLPQKTDAISKAIVKRDYDSLQNYINTKRKISAEKQKENNDRIIRSAFKSCSNYQLIYSCKYAPNVDIIISKRDLLASLSTDEIKSVYMISNNEEPSEQYDASQNVSNDNLRDSNLDPYTFWQDVTGVTDIKELNLDLSNVKIGLLDAGIPYVEENSIAFGTDYNVFQNMFDENYPQNNRMVYRQQDINWVKSYENWIVDSSGLTDSQIRETENVQDQIWHAKMGASLIVGETSFCEGVAPDVKLYCASESTTGTWKGAFEWLIDQGVFIICENNGRILVKYHDSEEIPEYYDFSIWIDHIAKYHNVNVVIPSGNGEKCDFWANTNYFAGYENTVFKNAISYNSIIVGNYDASDNSLLGSYSTINTLPCKPDVIAPGVNIGTPLSTISSGTSCSAPITAGSLAYLCQNPYYPCSSNPCLTKALLMSSADFFGTYNQQNTIGVGFDRQSGAGLINIYKAYNILQQINPTFFHGESIPDNQYDFDYGMIIGQSGFNSSRYFYADDIEFDFCYSLVWTKNNHIDPSNHSSNATDEDYPSIKVTITAPGGNQYISYYENDCKANVVFTPMVTGKYTISWTLMNNYQYSEPIWFGEALCRNKDE